MILREFYHKDAKTAKSWFLHLYDKGVYSKERPVLHVILLLVRCGVISLVPMPAGFLNIIILLWIDLSFSTITCV